VSETVAPLTPNVGQHPELGRWSVIRSSEDKAYYHRARRVLLLVTAVACIALCVFGASRAISAEYRLADSLQLDDPVWQLAVSYDIPLREQGRNPDTGYPS
jgi:hypothetical protein